MTGRAQTLIVAAAIVLCLLPSAPAQAGPEVELVLGGGTILDWSEPAEVGNGFGAGVLLFWEDFGIGLAGAAVLPDSATQGQFGAFWIEGRWHPFGRRERLSPYAVAGLGLATEDDFDPGRDPMGSVRWVSGSPSFLGIVGFGMRYGAPKGLYLTIDLRTYNHTHGGINMIAGFTF